MVCFLFVPLDKTTTMAALLAALAAVPGIILGLGWDAIKDPPRVQLHERVPSHPGYQPPQTTPPAPRHPQSRAPVGGPPGVPRGTGTSAYAPLSDALYGVVEPEVPDGPMVDSLGRTFETFAEPLPEASCDHGARPHDARNLESRGIDQRQRPIRKEAPAFRDMERVDQRFLMKPGNPYDMRGRIRETAHDETWQSRNDLSIPQTIDKAPQAAGAGFTGHVPTQDFRSTQMRGVQRYQTQPHLARSPEHHDGRTAPASAGNSGRGPRSGATRTVTRALAQREPAPGGGYSPANHTAMPSRPHRDDRYTIAHRAASGGHTAHGARVHAAPTGVANGRRERRCRPQVGERSTGAAVRAGTYPVSRTRRQPRAAWASTDAAPGPALRDRVRAARGRAPGAMPLVAGAGHVDRGARGHTGALVATRRTHSAPQVPAPADGAHGDGPRAGRVGVSRRAAPLGRRLRARAWRARAAAPELYFLYSSARSSLSLIKEHSWRHSTTLSTSSSSCLSCPTVENSSTPERMALRWTSTSAARSMWAVPQAAWT